MKPIVGLPAIYVTVCLIAGCSLWPNQPPLAQVHDFGLLPAADHNEGLNVRVDAVMAPTWLSSDAIHYRLLYNDATALRQYADHRWAAPPSDLLAARLGYLLPPQPVGDGGMHKVYLLSANLLEFEQDFSGARDAYVRLVLEISLRRAGDGLIIAQHRFVMTQPATPDVQGAINGLAQLANEAAAAAVAWAQTQVQE
ncbi:MAG: ABC-type transport auxiliary lipoprotein family protein [Gammaproteobacteria bacterium]